jgi:hypothetical protein
MFAAARCISGICGPNLPDARIVRREKLELTHRGMREKIMIVVVLFRHCKRPNRATNQCTAFFI